jgi:hypothetical protein
MSIGSIRGNPRTAAKSEYEHRKTDKSHYPQTGHENLSPHRQMVISMLLPAQLDCGSASSELAAPAPKIQHTCECETKAKKISLFQRLVRIFVQP